MWKKRLLIGLGVLVAVLFGAKLLLLDRTASPTAPFVIDLPGLHEAATRSGALPTRIEVEKLADFAFPKKFVVAGDSFTSQPMVMQVHRAVYADGSSVMIDSGMAPVDAQGVLNAQVDAAAYARMQQALPRAAQIVFTHEHRDHVGGLGDSAAFDTLADKVVITQEQLTGPRMERDAFKPGALEKLKPLLYTGLHSVAPGVVLMKAPGHSTGSQLIYVELANGTRYLFVGDIAWNEENITRERGRPKLAELVLKEDVGAVASQLQAIHALPADVHVVVAHDPAAARRDLQAGLFQAGFSTP